MGNKTKKIYRESWNRLRKAFEKLVKPDKTPVPQLAWQPVKQKNRRLP